MGSGHLGPWEPLAPDDARLLFSKCAARWWVAGGWAIDLLVGRQTRSHEDFDVLVLRPEQHAVREHLHAWDVHAADPPGTLRPWPIGEILPLSVHDIWCRREPSAPWAFQLMIEDVDGEDWLLRRDHRIRLPLSTLAGRASRPGLPVLVAEVQLLYKSGSLREKDAADFDIARSYLSADQRHWLRDALRATDPDHRWISRLEED